MRALVVVGHPRRDSFSHALAAQAAEALTARGFAVERHDLYAEGFDPVLPLSEMITTGDGLAADQVHPDPLVAEHRRALSAADMLVVAHPNWWGKPPAIVAGWLDRVLVPGVAYELDTRSGLPTPTLQLRHLLVFNTSDTPPDREGEVFGDPLDAIWRRCVGAYLGEAVIQRRMFGPMAEADIDQRRRWLDEVVDLCSA